jgi:hypothetical protein
LLHPDSKSTDENKALSFPATDLHGVLAESAGDASSP